MTDTIRPDPHNTEVEAALLGAIITDNRAYDNVADFLLADHFYEPVHGRIYEAVARRIEKGQKVTPSVLMEFADDPDLKDAGGQTYIYDLASNIISISGVRHYGEIIRDLYLRRQLIVACVAAEADAGEIRDTTALDVIESHEEQLHAITKGPVEARLGTSAAAFDDLLVRTDAAMKRETPVVGIPTGFPQMDQLIGGLQDGMVHVIGARPSMGKTALACNIAWNAANEGYPVAFFSLEMSAYQIAARFAAMEVGLSVSDIQRGNISMDDWRKIESVHREIAANIALYIDDSGRSTVAQIRSRVRRLLRKESKLLVVIDYLGLVEAASGGRSFNRTEQVSAMTREIKQMAKDLDLPVVLLSQLSRELERRDNKRPMLSDLRESGSIEQDADVVMFLYRDEYYLRNSEPVIGAKEKDFDFQERHASWSAALQASAGVCEAIVAKNRQGPTYTLKLYFDGATNTMTDLDRHIAPEQERMELEL